MRLLVLGTSTFLNVGLKGLRYLAKLLCSAHSATRSAQALPALWTLPALPALPALLALPFSLI